MVFDRVEYIEKNIVGALTERQVLRNSVFYINKCGYSIVRVNEWDKDEECGMFVFEYLFSKKGARRIYAYTEDNNLSSQHLCEKLGMRREGMFMEFVSFINDTKGNPIYENTIQYAMLKKEWKK